MNKIINVLFKNIIELLFSIVGTETIFASIYRGIDPIYFTIIIVLNIIAFVFYNIVLEREEQGPKIYIPVSTIVLIIIFVLIKIQEIQCDISYSTWVFNGGHLILNCTIYEICTLIFITFMFSSMYFYFSVKVYRKHILLLFVFMVVIIHMKCIYDKYNILVYSFIILFACIMFKGSAYTKKKENEIINIRKLHSACAGIIFVSLLGVMAFCFPYPKSLPSIPFLDSLKQYFNVQINPIDGGGFNVELNKNRNVDESTKENSETVIFEITGSNPKYLVNHNYDNYDRNEWQIQNSELLLGQNLSKNERSLPIDFTLNKINSSSLSNIKNSKLDDSFGRIMYLSPINFSTYEISHPSNTTKCEIQGSTEDLFLNGYDMIMNRKVSYFPVNNKYKMSYNTLEPKADTKQDLIMRYFNRNRYDSFLKEVCDEKTANKKLQEMEDEIYPYIEVNDGISKKVRHLSKELTKSSESNYDKAKEIENYLKNGEYVYDLSVDKNNNSDDYINYFILNSKKGYCVQFATAMTIMCREAGVPARYVEGYLVSEEEFHKDTYEVRESYAHAFVEVYIPGDGWQVFDPTPSIDDTEEIFSHDNVEIYQTVSVFKVYYEYIIIIIAVLSIFALIFFMTKRYRKIKKILRKEEVEVLEGLIKDSIDVLKMVSIKPFEYETETMFAKRIYDKYNITLINIIDKYYDAKFAGKDVSKEDIKNALDENRKVYKFVKKYKRKSKVVK